MKLILGCKPANIRIHEPCVLTIGNFDGLHLGHQALLERTLEMARKKKVSAAALTFNPHPMSVLKPNKNFLRLFDVDDQIEQIKKFGFALFIVERFDEDFAKQTPEDFLDKYLFRFFNPVGVVVGYDFNFGCRGEGDSAYLKKELEKRSISFASVEAFKFSDQVVSSSRIRDALINGETRKANLLLGRDYYLKGVVQKGDQRGRQLGFPTANIAISSEVMPRTGVYTSVCNVGGVDYQAVSNLGRRPTFHDEKAFFLETHIFDFSEDIYGQEVRVSLKDFLRPEKKFSSVDELKEQIAKDIEASKSVQK